MQALYAYYQSDPKDIRRTEQELLNGTEKIYELYLSVLQCFQEISHQEHLYYEDTPASVVTGKRRAAASTLKSLAFFQWLDTDKTFNDLLKKKKLTWQQEMDAIRKAFSHLRQQDEYLRFTSSTEHSKDAEVSFIKWLTREFFSKTDFIPHVLEEKNIYWAESIDTIETMVNRTLESVKTDGNYHLLPLFKGPACRGR